MRWPHDATGLTFRRHYCGAEKAGNASGGTEKNSLRKRCKYRQKSSGPQGTLIAKASWLVQSGVSLLALKEMGGWETLKKVQKYAHLSAGHLTEHASKIGTIISRNGTNTAQEETWCI